MSELEQGSLEWHEYREAHANASEAAAVMDAGRFQPRNKRELSMVRNGQLHIQSNEYMRRGQELEGAVRTLLNARHSAEYEPKVLEAKVDGLPLSASYDGVDGRAWLEIKVCSSPRSSYWTEAMAGRIDESIKWQMLQQFLVGREHGIVHGLLYVCQADNINGGLMLHFEPSSDCEESLLAGWKELWPYIKSGKTYGERNDAAWADAARAYKLAKEAMSSAEKQLEKEKKRLLGLAGGEISSGSGITVTQVTRAGALDYSALPEEVTASLPRKPDTQYWTINTIKEKK